MCMSVRINSNGTMSESINVTVQASEATARQGKRTWLDLITARTTLFLTGQDYNQLYYYFSVTLVVGTSTECFNITLIPDNIVEENEFFMLSLFVAKPMGFSLENASDALVTIVNDDSKCMETG